MQITELVKERNISNGWLVLQFKSVDLASFRLPATEIDF